MQETPLNSEYWNHRYQQHETGWDIGQVSTPLKEYIDQLQHKDIAILIPGCGNSYEAAYLLQQGFTNVTVIDIAPLLVQQLLQKFSDYTGNQLTVIAGDFFRLQGQYDLILEQTFFCALEPSLRPQYAIKMKELLKPGGTLAGVLFNRDFEGGPPFGGNTGEYQQLFAPLFTIKTMAPCYNSIVPRAGAEVFITFKV